MEATRFTYEALGTTLVIHMPKELDHHNCGKLKRDTDLIFGEHFVNRLVFDFTYTAFMDSSGVGLILNRYKQMALGRGTAVYYGAGPQVKRILEAGGIGRLMRGFEDREGAVEFVSRKKQGLL